MDWFGALCLHRDWRGSAIPVVTSTSRRRCEFLPDSPSEWVSRDLLVWLTGHPPVVRADASSSGSLCTWGVNGNPPRALDHSTIGLRFLGEFIGGGSLCKVGSWNGVSPRLRVLDGGALSWDADHVSAWSNGGGSGAENCQILCITHNRAKGNR